MAIRRKAFLVTITITAPHGFTRVPPGCTAEGNRAVCAIGDLPPTPTPRFLTVEVVAPDQSGATFEVRFEIDGNETDALPQDDVFVSRPQIYRTFFVTTPADSGSGSLRSAIETANADCSDPIPCLIAFRIPQTAQAWHTVSLTSPLPRIRAPRGVVVDGTTQGRYFADTNAEGPEIELSGEAAGAGNGLEACAATIRGLTVNGFRGSGIVLVDDAPCAVLPQANLSTIDGNYIGTDPTGTRAVPNHRGIWIATRNAAITNNVISGNTFAGIFVARGAAAISGNRIGLARELQPLGNGASAVYLSASANESEVVNNYIGFNGHFGIAIARDADSVSVSRNSIQANAQHGIDWGLDGVITNTPVPFPEITSARYENGHTIIEGTTAARGSLAPLVALYANDAPDPTGYGEGQYVLGEIVAGVSTPEFYRFTFNWPGDLRGKWVAATATRMIFTGFLRTPGLATNGSSSGLFKTTSEFSRAVEVK